MPRTWFSESFVGKQGDGVMVPIRATDSRSVSSAVEARWFVAGDVGVDLQAGIDHDKERVDTYHFDSLSETASVKCRGRRRLFEEKWPVGAPA